ncbi:MAG: restriction endonuclease subunit S [Pseudomonadales bacterium]|nr:restriction endonuclease subunit S [Pseudomonadales bacterium]
MSDWPVKRLGDILQLNYGKSLPVKSRVDGDIPVYGSNGIVGSNNKATVDVPGLIVGRKGSAGRVHRSQGPFCPIDTTFYVTGEDAPDTDLDFLFYLLCHIDLTRIIGDVGVPGLNREMAYMELVCLPPKLPEQKKIAHILSTVQRAIEAQERIIQTTTELKKALMHKLFTEGLRNEPQKQTEIGPVPESWTPITLGELCEKPDGALQTGPFGSQLHKHEYQEEGIAVVNPTHLAGNRINHEKVPRVSEEVAQRLGKHRLRKFDILFARRGEIGRQGLVSEAEETWLCGTGCFLVRACKPFIDNRFLALYFATDRLVKWLYSHAAGAIMPNLNNSVMQRLPVFYPDQETQVMIIEAFATIDEKLSAAVQKQSALQDLFRTLLHELMTAKTRVHTLEFSTSTTAANR